VSIVNILTLPIRFLHAKLQLEALRDCVTVIDVEETLEALPTDINAIYMKTWERILAQRVKHSNLAKLVLLWITHAHGEMTIETLRRAVAVLPETYAVEPRRMVSQEILLSVCCGLVSVDETTKLVRLIREPRRFCVKRFFLPDNFRLHNSRRYPPQGSGVIS
jgi:ankyrin repeat domain-containing protein 50